MEQLHLNLEETRALDENGAQDAHPHQCRRHQHQPQLAPQPWAAVWGAPAPQDGAPLGSQGRFRTADRQPNGLHFGTKIIKNGEKVLEKRVFVLVLYFL